MRDRQTDRHTKNNTASASAGCKNAVMQLASQIRERGLTHVKTVAELQRKNKRYLGTHRQWGSTE